MPVVVACPKCHKKFNLPENMLGRPVKCTACSAQFKTPAPRRNVKQNPAQAQQLAAQQKAQAAEQQQAVELKKMGVEGVITRTPDVFEGLTPMTGSPDPLANHRIEDPGFGEVKYTAKQVEDEGESDDPMAAMFENPAIDNSKKSKPKNTKTKNSRPWYKTIWFWLIVIALIGAVVAVLFLYVL